MINSNDNTLFVRHADSVAAVCARARETTAEIDLREKIHVHPSGTGFRISPRRYLYTKRINPMIIYRRRS